MALLSSADMVSLLLLLVTRPLRFSMPDCVSASSTVLMPHTGHKHRKMAHTKPVVSLYRSCIFPAISPVPALCYTPDRDYPQRQRHWRLSGHCSEECSYALCLC